MKYLAKITSLSLIVIIVSLFITIPALAIPSLPSSFYGTVKVNDANIPDGTLIQALIGGQVYAEGFSQTYQGNSVYALDVRGDNTDTTAQDGGRDGDTIQFKIGGALANQTAVWHTATNVNLNLTASSSDVINTPQATPSPVPTQTAIIVVILPSATFTSTSQASSTPVIVIQPSQTPTNPGTILQHTPIPTQTIIAQAQSTATPDAISQVSSTPVIVIQPSKAAVQPSLPSRTPATQAQPSPADVAPENDTANGSGNIALAGVIIALLLAIIIGYIFLVLRRKKI